MKSYSQFTCRIKVNKWLQMSVELLGGTVSRGAQFVNRMSEILFHTKALELAAEHIV